MREYLHEHVAVHGPGQGSGKRRGGYTVPLQRCLLPPFARVSYSGLIYGHRETLLTVLIKPLA